mgnify:CR=1 FL=1
MEQTVPQGWGRVNKQPSPYALVAERYLSKDLPVIPVSPGSKVPGHYDMEKGWRMKFGWQGYAQRMPTDAEVAIWSAWPDAGVCLPLGGISELIAIDIDSDDPGIIAALEAEFEGMLVCRRRGRKGYAAFLYMGDEEWAPEQTIWNVRGQRVVDLLHTGRQIVLPPTVHPAGMQYEWLPGLRLDAPDLTPGFDLPTCPADVCARITRALLPWQTEEDKRAQVQHIARAEARSNPADSDFRDANNRALDKLSAWVADLIPADMLQLTFGGYRAKPFWRGVVDGWKVGIDPKGIRDFAADEALTPIDLVMKVRGCDLNAAMDWLCPRIGIVRERVIDIEALRARFTPEFWSNPVPGPHEPTPDLPTPDQVPASRLLVQPVQQGPVAAKPAMPDLDLGLPGGYEIPPMPARLLEVPGVGQEIVAYMLRSAISPVAELAIAGALAFGAYCMGRVYEGPTGARSNLYLLGVARTGQGKQHPQTCVGHLANAAGMGTGLGSGFKSGSALLAKLADDATGCNLIYTLDEVHSYLRAGSDKTASAHQREALDYLMSLYSASTNPAYVTADYADRKLRETKPLMCPSLTLFGMTTPDSFLASASSSMIASGLLGRFVVVPSPPVRPALNYARANLMDVPSEILSWAQIIRNGHQPKEGEELRGISPTAPKMVGYSSARARAILEGFGREVAQLQDELFAKHGDIEGVVARWVENAQKIALICAGFRDPYNPRIDEECAEWAVEFVRHYGRVFLGFVLSDMGNAEKSTRAQAEDKVLAHIAKAGATGVTRRELMHACKAYRNMAVEERQKTLAALLKEGVLIEVQDGRRRALVAVDPDAEGGEGEADVA